MPTFVRFVCVAACLVAVPLMQTGCGEQKKQSEIRAEEGQKMLVDTMDARRKRILASLPTGDEATDEEHPWLAWIKRAVTVSPANDLKKAALKGKRSPAESQANALASFYDLQRDLYLNEKAVPNDFLRELAIVRRAAEGQPFEVDVEFDALFFHAVELARTHTLFVSSPHDDRVTRFFTYWKDAFGFAPKTSIFEDEVNALCAQKLADFCRPVPMEERPFQVMRPYFEKIAERIDAYKAKFPASPYNPLLDRMAVVYRARATRVPAWSEVPLLPGIRSTIAAPIAGNAVLSVSDQGVMLMDNVLRGHGKQDAPWKGDFARDTKLIEEVSALAQDVRSTTVSQFNQSLVYVVPEPTAPVGFIEDLLRATIVGENAKEWPTAMLVGRRREDGSNRRAGFYVTMLAKDKAVPFRVGTPEGKTLGCNAWAVVGKDLYEAKGFKPIVYHVGSVVHAGRLADKGKMESLESAPPHGEGDRLEVWAERQNASVVVAVPRSAPYSQLVEALNGVALRCSEGECNLGRSQPVFVATCE